LSSFFHFTSAEGPLAAALPLFVVAVIVAILFHRFRRPFRGSIVELGVKAILRGPWLLVSIAVLVFLSTFYAGKLSSTASVTLEADMRISKGQIVGAYVNEQGSPPKWLSIVPNQRRIYRFEHIPATVTFLRIDPSDAPDTQVSIFSIAIVSEGRVVRKFSPVELAAWRLYNLKPAPGEPDSYSLISSSGADFLSANTTIVASQRPTWFLQFLEVFQEPSFFSLIFMLCFFLFLACGLTTKQGLVEAGIVATLAVLAHPLAVLVSKVPVSPPPVTSAVGTANYLGYGKFEYLAAFVLLVVSIGIAWLSYRFVNVPIPSREPEESVMAKSTPSWRSVVAHLAVLVWLLMLYCPDLTGILGRMTQIVFLQPSWDGQNFLLWEYLAHYGYLPFRDFWYPYSGLYVHMLPFPEGVLLAWLQLALTLWILYLGLRYALARKPSAAAFIFVLVLLPVLLDEFSGWYRYLLAIDVALFYLALQDINRLEWRKQIPFALVVCFVCFYEPTQLIYAGTGVVAHSAWTIWSKVDFKSGLPVLLAQMRVAVWQRLIYVGGPLLAGILPVLILITAKGMLPQFIRFHLTLSDQQAYGSIPAAIVDWTKLVLQLDTMFVALFFALALAFYTWFRNGSQPPGTTVAALVIGLAGFMAMQKHLTRPSIITQLQVYPYLCVLLYVSGAWSRKTKAQTAVAFAFLGFIFGVAAYRGPLPGLYQSLVDGPAKLAGNFNVLFHESKEIRAANASKFDPVRFSNFDAENAVLGVLRSELGWNRQQRVFVLGDESVFYILLREVPSYMSNNYNMSPIGEQQHVLRWLHQNKPRFVIWYPSHDSYGGVPHAVRLPLIYQFVVENYRPVKAVGPYQILIASTEHPASDSLLWEQLLGTKVDLGHIPELAKPSDYQTCLANAVESCQPLLVVHSTNATQPGKAVVTIDSVAGPVQIAFDMTVGKHEYIIDLDRLWFRSFLTPNPRMTLSVPEAELIKEFRIRKSNVLY
jgi:hypothetical protein